MARLESPNQVVDMPSERVMGGTRVKGRNGQMAKGQANRGQGRDVEIARALGAWFAVSQRELPWRRCIGGARDPYASLVSEIMLQQTQVSRVVERFDAFIERFPTVQALAEAPEGDVLAMWAGMGYYRRARSLQGAARAVVERHEGVVPREVKLLRGLPGVGRYTAGAIASIVFGEAEATVDGNIARVLLRLDGRELSQEEGVKWAWGRAPKLVRAGEGAGVGAGVLNEAMMELGATVCLPRGARCQACPVRAVCRAAARGKQERIPAAKARGARRELFCAAAVLEDGRGRVLVEQRGEKGMWAGLWQVVTVESEEEMSGAELERALGVRRLVERERFTHVTTHRDVRFTVWQRGRLGAAEAKRVLRKRAGAVWKEREGALQLGISNAQRRVIAS